MTGLVHDRRSVVLLHGVQSSRLSWWRIVKDLTDLGWEVHALDMLAHGDRRYMGSVNLTVADLADDVFQQVPGPVDLVAGHSLGAIVALTVAQLRPGYTEGIVIEEPPGLAGSLDSSDVADDIERSARLADDDPEGAIATLLGENRLWSCTDAENAVESLVRLDVEHITGLLHNDRWDLQALVAGCPVPVHLLAATDDTGLIEPDRTAVMRLLPKMRTSVIESGHSIHRDRPGLWLHEVLQFADRASAMYPPEGSPDRSRSPSRR